MKSSQSLNDAAIEQNFKFTTEDIEIVKDIPHRDRKKNADVNVAKRTSRGQRGNLRALAGICEFHQSPHNLCG